MIDGIRRKLRGSDVDEFDWDVNSQLEVDENESTVLLIEKAELPVEAGSLELTNKTINGDSEYYHRFIQSCIDSEGKFGDQSISLGWLKTTLAGLEGKEVGTSLLWEAEPDEEEVVAQTRVLQQSGYEDLLPTTGAGSSFDLP